VGRAIKRMAEQSESALGPLFRPEETLLLVLDEAAHVAPIPDLEVQAATGGSQGTTGVIVYQDLSQARQRLGWEKASSIASNCQARIIAGGMGDPDTISHFVRLAGEEEITTTGYTVGADGQGSTSSGITRRPIADASRFRTVRRGHAILVYSSYPLAEVTLQRGNSGS